MDHRSVNLIVRTSSGPVGKRSWEPVLQYIVKLRARCVQPPAPPFTRRWVNIGPGYCYGPACGHIDLVHMVLDFVADDPELARDQMLNLFDVQRADGSIPFVWMGDNPARRWLPAGTPLAARLQNAGTYPPWWPVAVEACLQTRADEELLVRAQAALTRLLAWFDANRRLPDGGYFYEDVFGTKKWESGMDQSIRFQNPPPQPVACVDATSHVFWCRQFAALWAIRLGEDAGPHEAAVAALRPYIQRTFWCPETNWFHDPWHRQFAFEGMWPLVVGAASDQQAAAALDGTLLHPERFNTPHPIATVGRNDAAFQMRMLHGPAWNAFTMWAALGCLHYGRPDGARQLLEKALDRTAAEFARTGTVWEFYHSLGGRPEDVARKPGQAFTAPCREYYGHNPLWAMARIWKGLA